MMLSNKYTRRFFVRQFLRSSKQFQTLSFPVSSGRSNLIRVAYVLEKTSPVTSYEERKLWNDVNRVELLNLSSSLRMSKPIYIAFNLNMQDYAFYLNVWLQYRLVIDRKFIYKLLGNKQKKRKIPLFQNLCATFIAIVSCIFLYVGQEKCRGQRQRNPLLPKKRTR